MNSDSFEPCMVESFDVRLSRNSLLALASEMRKVRRAGREAGDYSYVYLCSTSGIDLVYENVSNSS